jgi:hypothetical protein
LFREGGGLAHAPVDTPSEGFVAEVDHLGFDSLVASVSKILGQGD